MLWREQLQESNEIHTAVEHFKVPAQMILITYPAGSLGCKKPHSNQRKVHSSLSEALEFGFSMDRLHELHGSSQLLGAETIIDL